MNETAEIFCPVCKLKNDSSALVCAHCQSPLPRPDSGPRTTNRMETVTRLFDTDELIRNAVVPSQGVIILSQESGQEIATTTDDKFILGRAVEGVPDPIIDLSAFGAYGLGVSRLHASVQKTVTGYEISDLDSTNGTWLNDQELISRKSYPIQSGDIIRLGKMYLVVMFKNPK